MNRDGKIGMICVVVAGVVFIAVRLLGLTESCLWFDEIFSLHAAGMSFPDLLEFVARDLIHPPLSYVFLKLWIIAGGESLLWVRLFPVVFSVAAIVPFFLLCRVLKIDRMTVALALFFLACNGGLIRYSQEVRMYAPLFFFSLLSMWLFSRFLVLGKNIWILTIVNVLLIYTHYFGWLVLASEIAAIVVLQRIKIRQILIMLGINIVAFFPWAFAVWRAAQGSTGLEQNIGWNAAPDLKALWRFVLVLAEPFYYQQSNVEPASIPAIALPLVVLMFASLCIVLYKRRNLEQNERDNLRLLVVFILVPVAVAFAASWIFPYSVWGTRHLILVFAPFSLLAAIVVMSLRPRGLSVAVAGVMIVIFGAAFFLQQSRPQKKYIWCAWENLAAKVDRAKTVRIYVFEDLVAYDLWFALRGRTENAEIIKVNGVEGMMEDKAFFLPRGFDAVGTQTEMTGDRFYLMYRAPHFDPSKPPLSLLESNGYKIGNPEIFEGDGGRGFLVEVWK